MCSFCVSSVEQVSVFICTKLLSLSEKTDEYGLVVVFPRSRSTLKGKKLHDNDTVVRILNEKYGCTVRKASGNVHCESDAIYLLSDFESQEFVNFRSSRPSASIFGPMIILWRILIGKELPYIRPRRPIYNEHLKDVNTAIGYDDELERRHWAKLITTSTTTGDQIDDFNADKQRSTTRTSSGSTDDADGQRIDRRRGRAAENKLWQPKPTSNDEQFELATTTRGARHNDGC
ncbi:unnamed protein product [Heligmosomoides polygyrus]|uniref:Doublecortin domain-containing protein n=1 Tax=Heligmosomoides polygyrus TaxID=6339 RepID=A0A183FY69_HELPZ|nr:unnamed protein product [Heligmosomoides polygyrus]